MRSFFALAIPVILALLCTPAAAVQEFTATLTGARANTPSTATGLALVTYDPNDHTIDWTITYTADQLIYGAESVTVAHFHRITDTGIDLGVPISASPLLGTDVLLTPAQEANLLGLNWYFNLHTTAYPAGEIAGDLVPEPATLGLLAAGTLVLWRRRRI